MLFKPYDSIEKDFTAYKIKGLINEVNYDEFLLPQIPRLAIGLSPFCNLDCVFCFNHFSPRFNYYKNTSLDYKRLLKLLAEYKSRVGLIPTISLEVAGEPLVQKDIWQTLEDLGNFTNNITITTNLQTDIANLDKKLKHTKVKNITVSCDASEEETYAFLRKKGKFERLVKNLECIAENTDIAIGINSLVFKENLQSLLGLPKLAQRYRVHTISLLKPHLMSKVSLRLPPPEEFELFVKKMKEKCEKHNVCLHVMPGWLSKKIAMLLDMDYEAYQTAPCPVINTLQIDPYGRVMNCCYTEWLGKKNGNPFYKYNNLLEIYNLPPLKKLYFMNYLGIFPRICIEKCHKKIAGERDIKLRKVLITISGSQLFSQEARSLKNFFKNHHNADFIVRPLGNTALEIIEKYNLVNKIKFAIDKNPQNKPALPFPVKRPDEVQKINNADILFLSFNPSIFISLYRRYNQSCRIFILTPDNKIIQI